MESDDSRKYSDLIAGDRSPGGARRRRTSTAAGDNRAAEFRKEGRWDIGLSEIGLITGGATGIGWALARRFLAAGSEVVLAAAARPELDAAARQHAHIQTRVCDLARESDRVALAEWIARDQPRVNALVNNAGIQTRMAVAGGDWATARQELAINLEAPIHLSMLLAPHLARRPNPAIVDLDSGSAFVPLADTPVYRASKAALHSFTLSLRRQLADTPVQVIEVIPPAVEMDPRSGADTFGVAVNEFADAVMARLAAGDPEITYGFAEQASRASRQELDAISRVNGNAR